MLNNRYSPPKNEQNSHLLDPWILGFSICLLLIGLVMVASSSISTADRVYGQPFHYLIRQLIAVSIGFVLGTVVIYTPSSIWRQYSPFLLGMSILLLTLVIIPGIGKTVNGSSRWIPLGVFNLQVSEIMKIVFPIFLADFAVRRHQLLSTSWEGLKVPVGLLVIISILLLAEPDLGATVVIFATALGMLLIAGVPMLFFIILSSLVTGAVILLTILVPYRFKRLLDFLNPWDKPFEGGFHLTQSLMAVGRDDWLGAGLGRSIHKLDYLPEKHTDFIFAILTEELGLFGATIIILLFFALVSRIFMVAAKAAQMQKHFEALLLYGFAIWIGLQGFINIGVNTGVLPTKGLTLPMISYGGSSVMLMCVVIALILRIEHELRFRPNKQLSLSWIKRS